MKLQKVKEEPEIPTASMADIAFLLIVFFMLTTVISATKGINHILPQDNNDQTQNEEVKAITLKIQADNMFVMDNKEPLPISSAYKVKDYVYEKVSRNYKKPIIVYTNPEAKYESMIAIFDAVKEVEARLHEEWKQEGKVKLPDLTISIPTLAEAADWGLQ